MRTNYFKISVVAILCIILSGCSDWFDRDPKNIITEDQMWGSPDLIVGLLANYYNRLPKFHGDFDTDRMCEIDDAMWSGHRDGNGRNTIYPYGTDYGRYWDYTFIRDINLAIENIEAYGDDLSMTDRNLFTAELRYLRAFVYFELVKRMGGVPLITTQLIYDFSGDPEYLQIPRSKEVEIYDFIYDELEDIKNDLAGNNSSQSRANTYAALALQSRSMLYAASIAKYNNLKTPTLVTSGGEVGMPAERANEFYNKSLTASKAILESGNYQLYNENPDKGENFYDMLHSKNANKEVIFVKDYLQTDKPHRFAYDNIVRTITEDNESSSCVSPSLGLVESYDKLDGTPGTIEYVGADGEYIRYNSITELFEGRDARLYGTVIYPGTTFKSQQVSIQAGVYIPDAAEDSRFVTGGMGSSYSDGLLLTGSDGPVNGESNVTNTGFYIRKHVSNAALASTRGTGAGNWWPWFRLGEIYLNAAEAALELNDEATALGYINTLRERAGFPANSLTSLTMEKVKQERRVELAFEDHRYHDLRRWRDAHEVWTGQNDNDAAVVYGLYPYRVAGTENQYIFDKRRSTRFENPRYFQLQNYYASIEQSVLDKNPKLVKNPLH